MRPRSPLLAALVLTIALGQTPAPAATRVAGADAMHLDIAVPGPRLADAVRQAFAGALAATGLRLTVGAWDGQLGTLEQRAAGGTATPGVVLMPNAVLLSACRQGLLWPLADDARDCGRPGFVGAEVLSWDRGRDQTPPDWNDFWDVARYPGKRGLPKHARFTLEVALMADGVQMADVYRILGASGGADRAFRKLDQLRPYLVWWSTGEEARHALLSGAVLMTMMPAALSPAAGAPSAGAAPGFGQAWKGGLSETLSWGVPRAAGTSAPAAPVPLPAPVTRFLAFVDDPAHQALVTALYPVVGAATDAAGALSADMLARTAGSREHSSEMLHVNDAFWAGHPDLDTRFRAWIGR